MSELQTKIEERIKEYKPLVNTGNEICIADEIEWLESLNVSDYVKQIDLTKTKINCDCGNPIFTHRHTNWIECTKCNKIKTLFDNNLEGK